MEAHSKSVTNLIQNDSILTIPYFQRRYVWRNEDRQRFIDDMEAVSADYMPYFLGALIFKAEELSREERQNGIQSTYRVIDGQQRLTTLFIYLKFLYTKAGKAEDFNTQFFNGDGEYKRPILIHSYEDSVTFSRIINKTFLTKENIDGSEMINAYEQFRLYFEDKQVDDCRVLLNAIKSCVNFVVIYLNDEDAEQQIFDTINSLGQPLNTDELMKNFLYEPQDKEAYEKNWHVEFDEGTNMNFWREESASDRQDKSGKNNRTIEKFFHNFVRIKMWDYSNQFIGNDRLSLVKESNVFPTCKAFHTRFKCDKQVLANEIVSYAQLFRNNLAKSILDDKIPQTPGIERLACIINASVESPIPYILYILKNVDDITERNKIFGFMELYLVRRMFYSKDTRRYSELFSEQLINAKVKTYQALKDYIMSRDADSKVAMPSDQGVIWGIEHLDIDEKKARLLHYLIWSKVRNNADVMGGFNDFTAEALMPKTNNSNIGNWPKNADPALEERRQRLQKTFGNYFLLMTTDAKALARVRNNTFDDKRDELNRLSGGVRTTKQMLSTLPAHYIWTETDIENRNKNAATQVIRLWSIENL